MTEGRNERKLEVTNAGREKEAKLGTKSPFVGWINQVSILQGRYSEPKPKKT